MAAARKNERIHALATAIARIADADRRLRLAAAERLGVGGTDFDALVLLDTAGPLPAGRIAEAMGITVRVPRPGLCTDNGAMVAALGAQLVASGVAPSALDLPADSSQPVTEVVA